MILILGFGVSGRSAANFLLSKGKQVIVYDVKDPSTDLSVEWIQDIEKVPLTQISLVILSPGIDPLHPLVQKAKALSIEVIGEIELGLRFLSNRTIGITGTNGKTTTVLLIAHILRQAGYKVAALGNVGNSFCMHLIDADPDEIFLLELSSFQLETVSTRCLDGAMILNITPNHLNRHASMLEYVKAKLKISDCLKIGAPLWISRQVEEEYGVLIERPFDVFDDGEEEMHWTPEALRRGVLGKTTIDAVHCICRYLSIPKQNIEQGIETFQKPAHRLEWVREINGIDYYNDSKSSSVHAVMHAVHFFKSPLILIAGGVDKGFSYRLWAEKFIDKVKCVIVFGQAAEKISMELRNTFPVKIVNVLQEAVSAANEIALFGDVVLFSPGCSSYDQFANFEERGDAFKSIVKTI